MVTDEPLRNFFIIAFLIPIVATVLVILKDGLQTGLVVEVVKRLLRRGADPNLRITYSSPVDGRVEKGVVALMFSRSLDAVTALLDAGADPNVHDEEGTTPLMRAVLATPPAAVLALLAAGADAQARNSGGETAADLVRRRLDWLRSSQASESAKGKRRMAELERILALLSAGGETR